MVLSHLGLFLIYRPMEKRSILGEKFFNDLLSHRYYPEISFVSTISFAYLQIDYLVQPMFPKIHSKHHHHLSFTKALTLKNPASAIID